jgi:hypothetical protein
MAQKGVAGLTPWRQWSSKFSCEWNGEEDCKISLGLRAFHSEHELFRDLHSELFTKLSEAFFTNLSCTFDHFFNHHWTSFDVVEALAIAFTPRQQQMRKKNFYTSPE